MAGAQQLVKHADEQVSANSAPGHVQGSSNLANSPTNDDSKKAKRKPRKKKKLVKVESPETGHSAVGVSAASKSQRVHTSGVMQRTDTALMEDDEDENTDSDNVAANIERGLSAADAPSVSLIYIPQGNFN